MEGEARMQRRLLTNLRHASRSMAGMAGRFGSLTLENCSSEERDEKVVVPVPDAFRKTALISSRDQVRFRGLWIVEFEV